MDSPPHEVFAALQRSGHWTDLTAALSRTESRLYGDAHAVALEFLGDRSTGFTWGRVSVSYASCAMQVSVEHTPSGRWFLALGALGTVGATGGDRAPANPSAPTWAWHPAGRGLVAGLWNGTLDVGEDLECTVRVEPYHLHPSDPRAEVSTCLSLIPARRHARERAWELGVRFLGALCSGSAGWTAPSAAPRQALTEPAHATSGAARPQDPADVISGTLPAPPA
ncbi:hypothetical protein ACFWXK_10255 [Streptomyces sp. NPDC059070]|uniref:hypothetical protein n=1 Tax=Streptomyces sp. NPDC059070 TaxID=3346713 RepID=UPI0036BC0405